jgi:hypothetical protein
VARASCAVVDKQGLDGSAERFNSTRWQFASHRIQLDRTNGRFLIRGDCGRHGVRTASCFELTSDQSKAGMPRIKLLGEFQLMFSPVDQPLVEAPLRKAHVVARAADPDGGTLEIVTFLDAAAYMFHIVLRNSYFAVGHADEESIAIEADPSTQYMAVAQQQHSHGLWVRIVWFAANR